ncbi:TetR/AcrR family transcriptional regulator [Amycolatopsis jiangsuensis]|uniref:AcrR family transcriptional regulator n=1 Tax=Amycolatopsis jiangsuensis TaxID=1181879 RepID=A0A840IRD4_9PSEU|nr:TetR/AcrR family transcriptional regulator [Amycolatopsis jiangsuensis]MBB4684393.1 AcrR family transcriptional regulator [Amycolatopsis jiangsuensis]
MRKDAARNRHRIIEVARHYVDDGKPLQLNDVARTASIGVATVYRHFHTPEALLETVAHPAIEELVRRAGQALTEPDPWTALRAFLAAAIEALLTDPAVPPVFSAVTDSLEHTGDLKRGLVTAFTELLARAHAAEVIDSRVTEADMAPLMCGVAFAANVHSALDPAGRAAHGLRYLELLLNGLSARASR